jgi:hypothetical protein
MKVPARTPRTFIEVVDVATPMTTLRFTGNGHGYRSPIAAMALALFTGRRLSQTLPGLANFYMVGQWAGVAGVPLVAAMGRDLSSEWPPSPGWLVHLRRRALLGCRCSLRLLIMQNRDHVAPAARARGP